MTKKFKSILFLSLTIVLILSAVTILSACNSDPLQITFAPGDHYTFNSTVTEAVPGDVVTFNVTASAGYKIDKVFANSVECTLNADGSYSFNMPEEPVTVTATASAISVVPGPDDDNDDVTTDPAPTTEKLTDDFMSFTGFCPDKISAFANNYNAKVTYTVSFSRTININSAEDSTKLRSSDQNVIPDSALTVWLDKDGTVTSGATISIDLNAIRPGTAYVSFYAENDISTSQNAEVTKKIEVVAENTLEIPRQTVTFEIDFSKADINELNEVAPNGLILSVSDRNNLYSYAEGKASSKEFTLDLNAIENDILTITFEDFAVGHNYSVSISYRKPDGYYSFVDVNDHVNSDYSYINSQLTVNSSEAVTVQLEISR